MTYISTDKRYRMFPTDRNGTRFWLLEIRNAKRGLHQSEYVLLDELSDDEILLAIADLKLVPIWKIEK